MGCGHEPGIRLDIWRTSDGVKWDLMDAGPADPLYSEVTSLTANPAFESVVGTLDPPNPLEYRFLFRVSGSF